MIKKIRNADYMKELMSYDGVTIDNLVEDILDKIEDQAIQKCKCAHWKTDTLCIVPEVYWREAKRRLMCLGFYFTKFTIETNECKQEVEYKIHWV